MEQRPSGRAGTTSADGAAVDRRAGVTDVLGANLVPVSDGAEAIRCLVYGCSASLMRWAVGPCSTTSPCRMTTMPVRPLGGDPEVVGDEQHRRAVLRG